MERRHGNAADVTEGHVGTASKVGELDLERVQVTSEVDQTSRVGKVVDVDGLEAGVLGDVENTNGVKRDTVQAGQTSVGDVDVAGLRDTGREVKLLQSGKSTELDATDLAERAEAQGVELGETLQLEGVANGAQSRSRQREELGSVIAAEATRDLLNTIQGKSVGNIRGELNVTIDLLAAVVLVGVALAGDLDGLATAARWVGQLA